MRGVKVSWIQVVSRVAASARSLPLRIWGGDGTGELAVEQRLFTARVGAFLQGSKPVGRLGLGDIRQGHCSLRLGVCVSVSSHHIISTLYLYNVAVCSSQQVLGVSCNLGYQTWASRTADLPTTDGVLRSGRVQAFFGLYGGNLGLWGAAHQLRRNEKIWDPVGGEDVAVGRGATLLVPVLPLSQNTTLHRPADLIQNPHGPHWKVGCVE